MRRGEWIWYHWGVCAALGRTEDRRTDYGRFCKGVVSCRHAGACRRAVLPAARGAVPPVRARKGAAAGGALPRARAGARGHRDARGILFRGIREGRMPLVAVPRRRGACRRGADGAPSPLAPQPAPLNRGRHGALHDARRRDGAGIGHLPRGRAVREPRRMGDRFAVHRPDGVELPTRARHGPARGGRDDHAGLPGERHLPRVGAHAQLDRAVERACRRHVHRQDRR